ncbi:hypothetical protein KEM54_000461 [Ascosphaera aggregata]|nr:hypothetical protein KEM54_000461 [Ascosphaera aggregata]
MEEQSRLPTSVDDLLFPSRELGSIFSVLSSLRKSTLSVLNRLRSIEDDAQFVQHVSDHYGLPLIANERCGSWYIPPDRKAGSAYFKSTDGHTGQWKFSLRRLNLQLLDIIARNHGCVIVDSTRRGKSMPDALSKTIPIWCAVLNRALFLENASKHQVQFASNSLGASEESQIERRIDEFVTSFKGLKLDLDHLRSVAQKPIQLIWVTRESPFPVLASGDDFHTVVLCSASKRVHGAEMSEGGYIQGAGDDAEAWAHGLTPPVFWAKKDVIMTTDEPDLPDLIARLVKEHDSKVESEAATLIVPTHNVFLARNQKTESSNDSQYLRIDCNSQPVLEPIPKRLNLGLVPGKLGSRNLRKILDTVYQFVLNALEKDPTQPILVSDESGRDLAVGVALMIICSFYDDQAIMTDYHQQGDIITAQQGNL